MIDKLKEKHRHMFIQNTIMLAFMFLWVVGSLSVIWSGDKTPWMFMYNIDVVVALTVLILAVVVMKRNYQEIAGGV